MFRRCPPGGGQGEKQNVKPYLVWYQTIKGFVMFHRTTNISINLQLDFPVIELASYSMEK